jgi:hypothetical protein
MKKLFVRDKSVKKKNNYDVGLPEFKPNLTIKSYITEKLKKLNSKTRNDKQNLCKSVSLRNNESKSFKRENKILLKNNTNSTKNSERNNSKDKYNFNFIKEISTSEFIFPLENSNFNDNEYKNESNEIEIEMLRDENIKLKNELNESKNYILKLEKVIQNLMKDNHCNSIEKCPIPMPAVIKRSFVKKNLSNKNFFEQKLKNKLNDNMNKSNPFLISNNELIITE